MRLRDGVRAAALFEAAKGLVVLIAGFGLLAVVHRDAQQLAESLVAHLHLNPASHYPRIFLDAAASVTPGKIGLLVAGAAGYVAVRLVEAWGLWHARPWAQWFAAVSGALYIPFELWELFTRGGWLPALVLAANVLVVGAVAMAMRKERRVAQP